jgi:hypothetical protein
MEILTAEEDNRAPRISKLSQQISRELAISSQEALQFKSEVLSIDEKKSQLRKRLQLKFDAANFCNRRNISFEYSEIISTSWRPRQYVLQGPLKSFNRLQYLINCSDE